MQQAIQLHVSRHDGAHGFTDTVPGDWSVERLTDTAVPRLRLAKSDVTSGKPLRYSALLDGTELPRDEQVGKAVRPGSKVVITPEYQNAAH